jgi:proteasome accessory factor A
VQPREDGKYRYSLSEKADHIFELYGDGSTRSRALVHSRDEPLADWKRYRRIHNVTGETVFSAHANALRLASESIILRACELGVSFDDLLPANCFSAMRDISHDPTLKTKVELHDGDPLSGLEIQRALAERAITAATKNDYLTAQEAEWGERWLTILDDLADDPQTCANRVDWVVKQNLIERELAAKRGSGKTDAAVAQAKAIDYHRLLPYEGMGMKLVRRGYFEDSPTEEVLDKGLPLPATRAKLRGETINRLRQIQATFGPHADIFYSLDWDIVRWMLYDVSVFEMKDPYATTDERIANFLDTLVA